MPPEPGGLHAPLLERRLISDTETKLSAIESHIATIEQRMFELQQSICRAETRQRSSADAERILLAARRTRALLLQRREALHVLLAEGTADPHPGGPGRDPSP
jgi:hypothetical protein